MQMLLGVLKRQQMEQAIGYPRYLIGATGQGASSLRRRPSDPLPLSELIFLYKDDDIRAWLLANPGKDPLDLLVLEARLGQDGNRDVTPAPASGRYPFFDRKLWDRSGQMHDTGEEDPDDDQSLSHNDIISIDEEDDDGDDSHNGDEETSREAQPPNRPRGGTADVVSFCVVQCAFHSIS